MAGGCGCVVQAVGARKLYIEVCLRRRHGGRGRETAATLGGIGLDGRFGSGVLRGSRGAVRKVKLSLQGLKSTN